MRNTRRELLTALSAPFWIKSAPAAKPNILFVAIDDLNDWIGCLGGNKQAITPNLDKLAARGTLFTSAHCTAPLCNPSRASLMTGVRPSTSGVYDNAQPFREAPALKNAVNLGQHLRANGYRSLGMGKIYHNGGVGPYGDTQTWDEYTNAAAFPAPKGAGTAGGAKQGHFDWAPLEVGDEEISDTKTAAWAAKQLAAKHDKPLFLATGIFRPHLPWYVPKKYFDLYPLDSLTLPVAKEDDLNDVPAQGKKFARPEGDHRRVTQAGKWKEAVQAYLASISYCDMVVGRLLRAVESSPMGKDLQIVLWSDHGWHLGEKSHWRKFSLWEESTRNVMMWNVPGMTKPGSRCDRTVSLLDIYPTLCELAQIAPPVLNGKPQLEGRSLVPLLKNPRAARREPAITTYFQNNHTIRTEQWRYIRYADGGEELYDRQKDPMEWTNLAGKPEFAKVQGEMAAWLPKHNEAPSPHRKGGEE
jgi:arylsulfatase A-like enzyme